MHRGIPKSHHEEDPSHGGASQTKERNRLERGGKKKRVKGAKGKRGRKEIKR